MWNGYSEGVRQSGEIDLNSEYKKMWELNGREARKEPVDGKLLRENIRTRRILAASTL